VLEVYDALLNENKEKRREAESHTLILI